MTKTLLLGFFFASLFAACKGASPDDAAAKPAGTGTPPSTASTASAAVTPSASASSAPEKVGAPIPEIDPALPVEKIDLAAYAKKTKEEKAQLVGKKLRLKGQVHGVHMNAMIFDQDRKLWGPEKEGTRNGVYLVELYGKKAPNETWSKETAGCYVDEKTQKELSAEFMSNKRIDLEVEGIVDRTFNELAPCRVISKKLTK